MYLSVYESRDGASESGSFPSPPSSLTYVHRWIGSRNPIRHSVPNFARLTYLSVYDSRDDSPETVPYPSPPSSLTYAHIIQSYTLLTTTILTFMCTQVLWCLVCLVRSRVSGVIMDPDIRITYSFYPRNPVYVRSLDPSVLVISLSLHRHPFVCMLFSSRFTCYKKYGKTRCGGLSSHHTHKLLVY